MGSNPTVVFGLDGACLTLVDTWLSNGTLPTLARLQEDGAATPIESCVPATTPPAWTTMTTGVNPGKHGVFGFYSRERGSYDITPVSDRDVHARRLWDYTTRAGLTALIVNVPVTHPARSVDGAVVPGFLGQQKPRTHPESLLADVDMEEYRVYAPSEGTDPPAERLLAEWIDLTKSRAKLARALMNRYDWDLLFVEFQKTDSAVHKFDERQRIRRIYECVDKCLADILDAVDETPNVFVVSDHGIGQRKKWAVALNTWLAEQGWLETTDSPTARKRDWREETNETGGASGANGETGPDVLARLGLTKQALERLLSRVGLYDIARRWTPQTLKDAFGTEHVDRRLSRAFYEGMGFSGVDVGVILNDERFYPEGTVTESEYDRVRSELMESLRELEGPAGVAFTQVQPREAVYHGPRTEYAPDIILTQAEDYVIGSTQPRGQTFIPTDGHRIDHTRHGLLLASGPDIKSDWTLPETPHIADITPTILSLLNCSLADVFDGTPLTELLSVNVPQEVESYPPYEPPTGTGRREDNEALRDRLQELGYLE